jgi:hypothetical protein
MKFNLEFFSEVKCETTQAVWFILSARAQTSFKRASAEELQNDFVPRSPFLLHRDGDGWSTRQAKI